MVLDYIKNNPITSTMISWLLSIILSWLYINLYYSSKGKGKNDKVEIEIFYASLIPIVGLIFCIVFYIFNFPLEIKKIKILKTITKEKFFLIKRK